MIIFGENISDIAGAIVKRNAISLVVSRDKECLDITFSLQEGSTSVPEFLRQLQLITAFPVSPFLLPFLKSNVHSLSCKAFPTPFQQSNIHSFSCQAFCAPIPTEQYSQLFLSGLSCSHSYRAIFTAFPVRPFVLPFLRSNIHRIR